MAKLGYSYSAPPQKQVELMGRQFHDSVPTPRGSTLVTGKTPADLLPDSLNGKLRNDNQHPILFQAIASVPSFELWLLLHYESIQATI